MYACKMGQRSERARDDSAHLWEREGVMQALIFQLIFLLGSGFMASRSHPYVCCKRKNR